MRVFAMLILAAAVQAQSQTDAPKRTLFDAPQAKKDMARPATPVRDAGSSALDAMISSTENLNTIRDSNVRRLTGDGCSPEASNRIAEIRGRLGIKTAAVRKDAGSETAALALASSWFKSPAGNAPVAAQHKKDDLLEAVLPGSEQKPEPGRDTANLQTELDHLLASCAGTKR